MMKKSYIPNIITTIRMIIIAPMLVFLLTEQYLLAFWIFIAAGVSDGVDGFLARTFGWKTPLGAFMDPLADKLLLISCFVALTILGKMPVWMMAVLIARDVIIMTGATAYILYVGQVSLEPSMPSKVNTTLQILLSFLMMFELAFFKLPAHLIKANMSIVLVLSCWTLLDYVWTWSRKAYFFTPETK